MFYAGTMKATIRNGSVTFPVLLVTGPRQAGNSMLLEKLAEPEREHLSLSNPNIWALANTDPERILHHYALPVLINEVQYTPDLFPPLIVKSFLCMNSTDRQSQERATERRLTERIRFIA